MIDTEAKLLTTEHGGAAEDGFRRADLRQSMGLVEHPCTGAEMLQYVIEAEYCRQDLERRTSQLSCLLDQSTKTAREAQAKAQNKDDFLAMMSHEIRTPLNGILGMAGVLLSRDLGSAERDCVETIRHSGEALLTIIDEILDFSKIEAGRVELECAEFEIAKAIDGALQIVRGAAERKCLRLCIEIERGVPKSVRGDMIRLRQVLINLLTNAIKFTKKGTITLKAELAGFREGEYELRFCVTDTGIGISERQQAKLFQPFAQADVSTTRKFGGTGLGLAISKRLAELMGGSIGVTSRLGQGSSFWFSIRALPSRRGVARPCVPTVRRSTSHATNKDLRILLVEDNSINQKVALLMLKNLGYKADLARNGKEALTAISSKRYDLVLMDCRMPEMDGFETTRRIRAQAGYASQVPIIALTANAFTTDRDACLASGMTDHLSKPVRDVELRRKLDFWLSGKGEPLGVKPSSTAV